MLIGTVVLAAVAVSLGLLWPWLALIVVPVFIWLLAFFRDPNRKVPTEQHVMVSPADGTVADISELPHDDLIGGPAVRIGIFLSVFNVHVNRSPCDGRVVKVIYKTGKFINAMRHGEASGQNESNTIVLAEPRGEKVVAVVRQIVGLIARRIVCTVKEGETLERGQRFGMIKFGSRTELTVPKWMEPQVKVVIGQSVRGAADVLVVLGKPIHTEQRPDGEEFERIAPRETPA